MTLFAELEGKARSKKSCHKGPKDQLVAVEDKLLLYIFEMRETGMAINHVLVLLKAASLSQRFCAEHFNMQYCAMKRFLKRHSYTYRMGMHESQCQPEEVANKTCAWMDRIRPWLRGPNATGGT